MRDGHALEDFLIQLINVGQVAILQHPELGVVESRGLRVHEGFRPGEQVIAVGEILHAQKSRVGKSAGQLAPRAGRQIEFPGVAEIVVHVGDLRSIGRPRGALAARCDLTNVPRKVVLGRQWQKHALRWTRAARSEARAARQHESIDA